ncbi:MAG: HI0074 family nucleotidyltransferase substrate-binding subunit [Alphaproteobacteria bacterium]
MNLDERYRERIGDFRKALAKLRQGLDEASTELGRDGVIQRFEFTYEQAWKTLKLWLAGKDIDVRNAKDALREALGQGLLDDGGLWSRLHENRNLTSHTYDSAVAAAVYAFIAAEGYAALARLLEKLETAKPG